jgi:hypothetical protein
MPRSRDQIGSEYQMSTISAMQALSRRAIDPAIG